MTRHTVAETRDKLLAPLAGGRNAVVDLSQVDELDHAGLEIMLLAKIEAMSRGRAVSFINHSRAVLSTLESSDLTHVFCDTAHFAGEA
jgi:anti-anti-sigma regulatory factor